jgi:hypothetical protein
MKPFVNIASPTGNIVLNFSEDLIHALVPFAIGYRKAAGALAASFRGDAYADYDGYPVLYLYRHSLELLLKAVVYRGAKVMGLVGLERPNVPGLFSRHELERLLPAVRAVFRAMDWEWDATPIGTHAEFENIVRQVDKIDPKSYTFRYPMSPSGEAEHFVVNVPNFAETLDVLLRLLEGANDLLDERFQTEAEAMHELEQLLVQDGEA